MANGDPVGLETCHTTQNHIWKVDIPIVMFSFSGSNAQLKGTGGYSCSGTNYFKSAFLFLLLCLCLLKIVTIHCLKSDQTSSLTTHSLQLIRVILAATVAVTLPACSDAVTTETGKLLRLTAFPCILDTVYAVFSQVPLPLMRTLALWAQWTQYGM